MTREHEGPIGRTLETARDVGDVIRALEELTTELRLENRHRTDRLTNRLGQFQNGVLVARTVTLDADGKWHENLRAPYSAVTAIPTTLGRGYLLEATIPNPAAAADFVVPTSPVNRWQLLSIAGKLTTSATAGTRTPAIVATIGGNLVDAAVSDSSQAASLSVNWNWNPSAKDISAPAANAVPLFANLLPAGTVVSSSSSLLAGDQWSNLTYSALVDDTVSVMNRTWENANPPSPSTGVLVVPPSAPTVPLTGRELTVLGAPGSQVSVTVWATAPWQQ
ncbi:MAG: hypothetical protein JWM85_383 [Acidimicrobiaceae bacterium]|nr:hypothetical protein [Acidimicrobiaceae bacterium]